MLCREIILTPNLNISRVNECLAAPLTYLNSNFPHLFLKMYFYLATLLSFAKMLTLSRLLPCHPLYKCDSDNLYIDDRDYLFHYMLIFHLKNIHVSSFSTPHKSLFFLVTAKYNNRCLFPAFLFFLGIKNHAVNLFRRII